MAKDSEEMGVVDFGRELILSQDLDPVYTLLWHSDLDPYEMRRWLLAYWCFYHVGTASWIAEGGAIDRWSYWIRMETAARSKDYLRGRERRHFRGKLAETSVEDLKRRGLSSLFAPFETEEEQTLSDVMREVAGWYGFGEWIAFKIADMLERLRLCEVDFDPKGMFMFSSPRKGARKVWEVEGRPELLPAQTVEHWALTKLYRDLSSLPAPPRYERPVNAQEIETVLCKWHSYLNGHYRLGEDVEACWNGLMSRSRTRISQRLIVGGRNGGLWN